MPLAYIVYSLLVFALPDLPYNANCQLMYFHKVSGTIPENKHKEFEQTFKFVGFELPKGCAGIEFSRDLENLDKYHFISFWEKLDSMEQFTHSSASSVLLGAFKTLGELSENKTGIMIEIN